MSHYFLCSQNKDSKNQRFFQGVFFILARQNFAKTKSRSPRGFLPRPLLRAGESITPPPLPQKYCGGVQFRFLRQDWFQKRFEFCTMNTANFRKGFRNQKYGRREAPTVLHSPHKILILQGFATLRVAPRLPIQFQFYE